MVPFLVSNRQSQAPLSAFQKLMIGMTLRQQLVLVCGICRKMTELSYGIHSCGDE